MPAFSIMAMMMNNYYQNNIYLLVLIVLISIIVIISLFKISPKNYPAIFYALSSALVLYGSLTTYYIAGSWTDMAFELSSFKLILLNGFWDYTISSNVNNMLSVTVLPGMISIITNISGELIFRLLYPLILACVL
jgi:uncharacterized membrane protein